MAGVDLRTGIRPVKCTQDRGESGWDSLREMMTANLALEAAGGM
jgi:hypothetical protein